MANDDLLHQLDKLIQQRLEANNKQLRQEVREDTKAAIQVAVDPIHERLDAQREHINTVEKNLRQNIKEDIKESEKNIIEQFSPITNLVFDHGEQIAELQKAVGLRPKQ